MTMVAHTANFLIIPTQSHVTKCFFKPNATSENFCENSWVRSRRLYTSITNAIRIGTTQPHSASVSIA